MRRSWLAIALLLSVGINVGVLATIGLSRARAEKPEFSRPGRWEGDRIAPRVGRLADRLGLDEEEKTAFLEQHRRFYDSLQELRKQLATTKEELRREVGAPSPDRQRIDELLDETAGLNALMERAFVDNVLATRAILDERQQEAYLGLLRHRQDRLDRADRGRRRPGEGPPGRRPPDGRD